MLNNAQMLRCRPLSSLSTNSIQANAEARKNVKEIFIKCRKCCLSNSPTKNERVDNNNKTAIYNRQHCTIGAAVPQDTRKWADII